jgi:hypothetical protein
MSEMEKRVLELEAGYLALIALIDALAVTHPNLDMARMRAIQNSAQAETGMLYTEIPDSMRESFVARVRAAALAWTAVSGS